MLELAKGDDKFQVLGPDWTANLVALGSAVVRSHPSTGRRLYCALLPTRSFAAILVSLGITLSCPPDAAPELHEWKSTLAPETFCWYPVAGGQFIKCKVASLKPGSETPIVIETTQRIVGASKGTRISVPRKMLSRLLPIDGTAEGGRLQSRGLSALRELFGKDAAYAFYGERRLDVVICGVSNDIADECRDLHVTIGGHDVSALYLTRPRAICGDKAGYRSDIVTAMQRPRCEGQPQIVIYDGAYAFLQWRRIWKDSTGIVILDESASSRARQRSALDYIHSLRQRGRLVDLALPLATSPAEFMGVEY